MIRHRVHRVLVRDGETILGVLEPARPDELRRPTIRTWSRCRSSRLKRCRVAGRRPCRSTRWWRCCTSDGIRIERIARLVRELNSQPVRAAVVAARAGRTAAPQLPDRDGQRRPRRADPQDRPGQRAAAARRLSPSTGSSRWPRASTPRLSRVRLPALPGQHHADQPAVAPAAGGASRRPCAAGCFGAEPEGVMNLAIFLDAAAVAGDADLLGAGAPLRRRHAWSTTTSSSPASPAPPTSSSEPGGWWAGWCGLRGRDEQAFDLKKLGTFPIVHGVRALALQHRVARNRHGGAAAGAGRTRAPAGRSMARDLTDALHFLMGLKIDRQPASARLRPAGQQPGAAVDARHARARPAEGLRWRSSRPFRQHLRRHFRLDFL